MNLDGQTSREIRSDAILKCVLALFVFLCLWFNYSLDADAHFVTSHLATLTLLVLAPAMALYRSRITIHKPWGTTRDYVIGVIVLGFISIRVLQSLGNQFFFGQFSKLLLIFIGWICFKSLDPDGRLLKFMASMLPTMLASGIVVGVIIWATSGKLGLDRLRIGPNDYEYVSEYAGLMLPLVLFSLEEFKNRAHRVLLLLILIVMFVGLVLTGARGPLLGSIVALLSYVYLARRRMTKAISLTVVSALVIVLITLGSTAYANSSPDDVNRFRIDEAKSLESFSSGRLSNWLFLIAEMISNMNWTFFGSGLGRLAEWVPSDGGFYRPAVTNGLLSAWVPFGLIGLIGYLYFCWYLWRRISKVNESPYRCMAISLFLAYFLTDQFETHWQGTNMLWYISFVLYLWTLARPALLAANPKRAQSAI